MDSTIASNVATNVRARGAATQGRILERAVHIASIEGLESMSLSTLAKATSMSKSGLFAHFRSKEALQIAIIDEAEKIFFDTVVKPAQGVPAGSRRLETLALGYVAYCARGPFEGGCFFAAAAHEFDGRPGPVRDRVIAFYANWQAQVKSAAIDVVKNIDALQFELHGIGLAANFHAQIGGGAAPALERGTEAARALLVRLR